MIALESVSKRYGAKIIIHDISFSVGKGEIVGFLGPNGAGKTTTMRMIAGYTTPTSGRVMVAGFDMLTQNEEAARRIGYLPEHPPLYDVMEVSAYLRFVARVKGVPKRSMAADLERVITACRLEAVVTREIYKLSKGYRQRVGVAQAILHQPELLILDEPTTGLDPTQIAEIRALIRELAESATVVLSTHILPEVEMTCDRVLVIMGGELRTDANLAELRASNAAVVAIKEDTKGVREELEKLAGVKQVEELDLDGEGYRRWRVSTAADANPCPEIFAVVRDRDWSISELRVAPRTLESVFHDLAEQEAS
jgi:ABC-2 type transport system ATP-binding protein